MKLPLGSLGKLLRLAELAERERLLEAKPLRETITEMRREFLEKTQGVFERRSAERDLQLFLQTLSDDEKRDVCALFYLGRHAGDSFDELRADPTISVENLPHDLSAKRDLEPSLIEGIKRLSE